MVGVSMAPFWAAWTCENARPYEVAAKLLQPIRSWGEVATKLDPLKIPCASPASPHPSKRESTKGGAKRRFVHGWCGKAGEAQGILNGANFVAAPSEP